MKKGLTYTPTKNMTEDQWHAFRYNNGVGGSDIGEILDLNKNGKGSVKLFHEKIGWWSPQKDMDLNLYSGKVFEDKVVDAYWRYWDPTEPTIEKFLENVRNNHKPRKCRRINAFIQNPDYPGLFGEIDRKILRNKAYNTPEGILEIKTSLGVIANQWKSEFPPSYILQIQTYLMITGLDYAEGFMLKDGRFPEYFPFEKEEELQDTIKETYKTFWDKVQKGRQIIQEEKDEEKKQKAIHELEPEMGKDLQPYAQFLKERYNPEVMVNKMPYTENLVRLAQRYLKANRLINKIEDHKTMLSNRMQDEMRYNSASMVHGDDLDKELITWYPDKNNKPMFRVKPVCDKFDLEQLKEESDERTPNA